MSHVYMNDIIPGDNFCAFAHFTNVKFTFTIKKNRFRTYINFIIKRTFCTYHHAINLVAGINKQSDHIKAYFFCSSNVKGIYYMENFHNNPGIIRVMTVLKMTLNHLTNLNPPVNPLKIEHPYFIISGLVNI